MTNKLNYKLDLQMFAKVSKIVFENKNGEKTEVMSEGGSSLKPQVVTDTLPLPTIDSYNNAQFYNYPSNDKLDILMYNGVGGYFTEKDYDWYNISNLTSVSYNDKYILTISSRTNHNFKDITTDAQAYKTNFYDATFTGTIINNDSSYYGFGGNCGKVTVNFDANTFTFEQYTTAGESFVYEDYAYVTTSTPNQYKVIAMDYGNSEHDLYLFDLVIDDNAKTMTLLNKRLTTTIVLPTVKPTKFYLSAFNEAKIVVFNAITSTTPMVVFDLENEKRIEISSYLSNSRCINAYKLNKPIDNFEYALILMSQDTTFSKRTIEVILFNKGSSITYKRILPSFKISNVIQNTKNFSTGFSYYTRSSTNCCSSQFIIPYDSLDALLHTTQYSYYKIETPQVSTNSYDLENLNAIQLMSAENTYQIPINKWYQFIDDLINKDGTTLTINGVTYSNFIAKEDSTLSSKNCIINLANYSITITN